MTIKFSSLLLGADTPAAVQGWGQRWNSLVLPSMASERCMTSWPSRKRGSCGLNVFFAASLPRATTKNRVHVKGQLMKLCRLHAHRQQRALPPRARLCPTSTCCRATTGGGGLRLCTDPPARCDGVSPNERFPLPGGNVQTTLPSVRQLRRTPPEQAAQLARLPLYTRKRTPAPPRHSAPRT